MGSTMFEMWAGVSPKQRRSIALFFIAISTVLYFAGELWIWGWCVGSLLLMFSGASQSEKQGYLW